MPSRLKALELHGYKTFAVKSQFEFPGMITAIVGPNGSGKSNIADSIRWVLGEQSYSLLRGKKTEDMIFAGSEQRPRAGMASASITFDNSEGWLPIDFSEVSITRRAYRDGQNEYLINGQRVRLREISELLAQSGLAERTYTVLGQGLVDAALALKPEERRRLFEEAAGIGLYRARKEESLNHLAETERNIERAEDILAEIEPRMKSLEKQAHRVIEYEQIKSDLRVLLRDWYGYHWQQSQQNLKKAQESLRVQETKLTESRTNQKGIEEQQTSLRLKIQEQREQLNDLHAKSADCHNQLESISRDLAVMNERQSSYHRQEENLQADINRLQNEHQESTRILETAETEQADLQHEMEDAIKHAEDAKNQLQGRQIERSNVEKQLREKRNSLVSFETKQIQAKAHVSELTQRLEQRKKEMETASLSIGKDQVELDEAQNDVDELNEKNEGFLKQIQAKETSLREIRAQIREIEKQQKIIDDQRMLLETEMAKMNAQVDVIEQAEKSYTGFSEGAQYLNQSFKQGRLKGDYHALSNLVKVPENYEQAITSALGEYLDLVILDKNVDLESVLKFLEGNNKGRTILMPIDQIESRAEIVSDQQPGAIGWASDLVACEDAFKSVIQAILGQVLVVEDRKAALALINNISPSARIVTLKGEVFTSQHAIILGRGGRSGVISRPRQKQELLNRKAEYQEKIALNVQEGKRIRGLVDDLRNEEDLSLKNNQQLTDARDALKVKIDRLTLTIKQMERQVEWLTKQKSTNEKEIAKIALESEESQKMISACEQESKGINAHIQELQNLLNSLSLEGFQREVNKWETEKAVIARGFKDVQTKIEDRKKALLVNQTQKATQEQRLLEIGKQLKEIEAKRTLEKNQETDFSQRIETLKGVISPLQVELKALEENFEEGQKRANVAQQALTLVERAFTQAQMELTHQREYLENLRHKIEDDFGLVSFDYEPAVAGPTPLPFDGLVEQLPVLVTIPHDLEENITRQKLQLKRIGAINPEALTEYQTVKDRHQFMTNQIADLRKAEADLRQVISELDEIMKRDFYKTFTAVANEFHTMFGQLFEGGSARLLLEDEEDINSTGIEIEARLPGKREQGLSLLSGGERSLTATALIFALLKVSPTPFCIMDEVDAMLDESNVGRFCALVTELSKNTQFILITHNRNTVKMADVVYGITLGRDSVSQVISLKLDEITDDMVK